MSFNQQADRNKRFRQQSGQKFVPQPAEAIPAKAIAGKFVIPEVSRYQKPADEYKKGPAGDTKHLVQVSEASWIAAAQTFHLNARNNDKAVPHQYCIPQGFRDEDVQAGRFRESTLPNIGTRRRRTSSAESAQRGFTGMMTTNMESQIGAPKSRHPLDYAAEWSQEERKRAYAYALQKVGEQGVDNILESVRDKVEQRFTGGIAQLNSAFHFFDKDHSASIDLAEFSQAMEACGLQFTETQMVSVFAVYDRQLTGSISYDEFKAAMQADRVRRRPSVSIDKAKPIVRRRISIGNSNSGMKNDRPSDQLKSKESEDKCAGVHVTEEPRRVRPPQFRQFFT